MSPELAWDSPLTAELHAEQVAEACPESPVLTVELAPSTPIAMPAESPVEPLVATASGAEV